MKNPQPSSTFSSSPRADWRRLLSPLCLAVVLLALCELTLQVAGFSPPLWFGKHGDEYDAIYTRIVQTQQAGKKVCVFIGDSRVEWGVSPETIQAIFWKNGIDMEVFNLAFPGVNVRKHMDGLVAAKFSPDCMVIGYSHLSFYYSIAGGVTPKIVPRFSIWQAKIKHFFLDNFTLAQPRLWEFITQRRGADTEGVNWIGHRSISPRGQAHIFYRIPKKVAIATQKDNYEIMYSSRPMPAKNVAQINELFYKQIMMLRAHGTRIFMIRMPVGGWVQQLERKNDPYSFEQLAKDVDVPAIDLNLMPGSADFSYLDDLHLAPPQ
jgi:hypothetical protein